MRPLRFVCRNPLLVLGAFTTTFVVWVWQDSIVDPVPAVSPHELALQTAQLQRPLPAFATIPDVGGIDELRKVAHGNTHAFPKLKPGMPRSEVEGLIGAPAAGSTSPAVITDGGRVTYHTQYEADLGPVATVRPIERAKRSEPRREAVAIVTLEFDATRPGHPLLMIYYPDPLF